MRPAGAAQPWTAGDGVAAQTMLAWDQATPSQGRRLAVLSWPVPVERHFGQDHEPVQHSERVLGGAWTG